MRNQLGPSHKKTNKDIQGRLKKAGLWGYGTIVTLVLGAMVYVLTQAEPEVGPVAMDTVDSEIQAILTHSDGAAVMPIANLEELLPVVSVEPKWREYAAAWRDDAPKKIAIVIDDLGLDENASKQLALMEGPLTLAYLPYAENLPLQTTLTRKAGHELMVHMPMQPKNKKADPGPNALLSGIPQEELERRIVWNLERFQGFVGINNHMGSALTEIPAPMVRVMAHLKKRGYLFLDSLTSPASVAERAAVATGVPHIARDIFLDNERKVPLILAQLKKTEEIASIRGYAVAIGHPYPETLKALEFWVAKLDKTEFALVPISQLVDFKMREEQTAGNQRTVGAR